MAIVLCALSALSGACTDENVTPDNSQRQSTPQDAPATNAKATRGKAEAIARLFAPYRGTDESGGNKAAEVVPEVTSVSFYVADGDTLLYAFNYGEGEGYTIVSADLNSFPILANSEEGAIDFNSMDDATPFKSFVEQAAEAVRQNLLASALDTSKVETWANITDPEYEYEIAVTQAASANSTKSLKAASKAYIHPYTGIALKDWGQEGDYSASAKAGLIGCPAVAIGMLLFDMQNRFNGAYVRTNPSFSHMDANRSRAKEVSRKLRIIADKIPQYAWKFSSNGESGATPVNIASGLRNLGFPNARLEAFNFDKAYEALRYETINPIQKRTIHCGILLIGYGGKGHIWFCDGYKEMSYEVIKRRRFAFWKWTVDRWTETGNFLYMNWGWHGKENGWYALESSNRMTEKTPYRYNAQMITGFSNYTPR